MGGGAFVFYYLSRFKSVPSPPKEEIQHHTLIIEQITALGQIELLQYQVRDVVQQEWRYVIPFTKSKVLLVVAGEARICIDFSKVKVVEANWETRSLKLELPAPTLCMVRVDPAQSQVYDSDFSMIEWWSGSEAERVREALTAAQETLRVRLTRQFPMEPARQQAETLLRRFCEGMGWKTITFVQAGQTPTAKPPA